MGCTMQICPSKLRIRQEIAQLRAAGKTIGLVPTMGFLHDGHLQLMRRAAHSADAIVATILCTRPNLAQIKISTGIPAIWITI